MASLSSPYFLTRRQTTMLRNVSTAVVFTALASTAALSLSGCSSESQGASVSKAQTTQSAIITLPPTPSAVDLLINEADAAFLKHDWDTATLDYTAVFNLKLPRGFTSSEGTGRYVLRKLSLSYLYEGLKFKGEQDYYLAIQDFESAIDDNPANSNAKRLLAEVMAEDQQRQMLLASTSSDDQLTPDAQSGDGSGGQASNRRRGRTGRKRR